MVDLNTKKAIEISLGGRYTRQPFSPQVQGLVEMCEWLNSEGGQDTSQMRMVEIGCFTGEGTEILAQYFGEVHCVDIWSKEFYVKEDWNNEEVFEWRILSRFDNVEKYKMKGAEYARIIEDSSMDFAYIDAMHWYADVIADIKMYMPKVKGKYIGGHDWCPEWIHPEGPGVIQAVSEIFGAPTKTFQDWSWVAEVKR